MSSFDEGFAHLYRAVQDRFQVDRHTLELNFSHRVARDVHQIVDQPDDVVGLAIEQSHEYFAARGDCPALAAKSIVRCKSAQADCAIP